jgi:hypothetical protein
LDMKGAAAPFLFCLGQMRSRRLFAGARLTGRAAVRSIVGPFR